MVQIPNDAPRRQSRTVLEDWGVGAGSCRRLPHTKRRTDEGKTAAPGNSCITQPDAQASKEIR